MKNLYLRSCVAMACALGLASCGGGDGNLSISGAVVGLSKTGLILQNNGGPELVIPAGSSGFVFPERVGSDTNYDVTIKAPGPVGAKCVVTNGKGKTGSYSVSSVVVSCITDTHELGGIITGLPNTKQIEIVNGSDKKTVVGTGVAEEKFQMSVVADGVPYGVTVLTAPTGMKCEVTNGVGTMGTANIANVKIACAVIAP